MTTLIIISAIILIYIIGRISIKNDLLFNSINDIIIPMKYNTLKYITAGLATIIVITVTLFIIGCIGLMFLLGTNI